MLCIGVCGCEQIEKLKQQLSEQEIGKRSQEEELQTLEEQLEQLKKEETEYRHKVRQWVGK